MDWQQPQPSSGMPQAGPRWAPRQRQWEPAWHRRQRRERQQARLLLAVAKADAVLRAHHSWPQRARPGQAGKAAAAVREAPLAEQAGASQPTLAAAGAEEALPQEQEGETEVDVLEVQEQHDEETQQPPKENDEPNEASQAAAQEAWRGKRRKPKKAAALVVTEVIEQTAEEQLPTPPADFPDHGVHSAEALDRAYADLKRKLQELHPLAKSRHSVDVTILQAMCLDIRESRESIQLGGYTEFDRFVELDAKFSVMEAALQRAIEKRD